MPGQHFSPGNAADYEILYRLFENIALIQLSFPSYVLVSYYLSTGTAHSSILELLAFIFVVYTKISQKEICIYHITVYRIVYDDLVTKFYPLLTKPIMSNRNLWWGKGEG